jgi:hypothetical protein
MWWLILIIVLGIVGFILFSRNSNSAKIKLSKEQLKLMQGLLKKEMEQNKADRQEIINQAAKDGKTIPLSVFLEKLEKSKEEHPGDHKFIAEMDRQINELKEKYDKDIPVDELYKLVTDYEDEYGPM